MAAAAPPLTYSLLSLKREQDRKESKRRWEGRPGRNPFLGRRELTSGLFPGGEDKRLSLNVVNDFSLLESGLITVFPSLPPDRGSALTAGRGSFFFFFLFFPPVHVYFFQILFCFLFLFLIFFFFFIIIKIMNKIFQMHRPANITSISAVSFEVESSGQAKMHWKF